MFKIGFLQLCFECLGLLGYVIPTNFVMRLLLVYWSNFP